MSNSARNNAHLTRGYMIALASAAFLSTTAIFIRYLTRDFHMPALVLAVWREALVTLTLLPVLALVSKRLLRVERKHLPYLILYGLMLATFNSLWTLSVSLNGAAVSTVLVYCSAAFTALLGWWFLNEQLSWGKLAAVALSLGGCALVSGASDPTTWGANLPGLITGILSGLWYAIYSLMGRAASQRGLNPWTTLLYTFGFATCTLLVLNLLPLHFLPGTASRPADLLWLGNSVVGWTILFMLAAGPTLAGYGLYNVSLSYLPSSVANLIVSLEPAFTAVIAFFLLGERLSAAQIGGGLMILAGVLLLRVYEGWIAGQAPAAAPEHLARGLESQTQDAP